MRLRQVQRTEGGRKHEKKSHFTLSSFSVAPCAVSNLTVHYNNGTSLWLSWQQPKGDLDAVTIAVSTNGVSHWNTTLPPNVTEVTVDQLTPGSAYQIAVVSKSGKLKNQSEITVRTGEYSPF